MGMKRYIGNLGEHSILQSHRKYVDVDKRLKIYEIVIAIKHTPHSTALQQLLKNASSLQDPFMIELGNSVCLCESTF
jgi:hypothetical protein